MNKRTFLKKLVAVATAGPVAADDDYRCVMQMPTPRTTLTSETYYWIVDERDFIVIENFSECD